MNTRIIKKIATVILVSAIAMLGFSACGSLMRSAASGDVEGIQHYLQKGENINGVDKSGFTPLMWAIYYGQEQAVDFLIKKGADINYRIPKDFGDIRTGSTPLMLASYYQNPNIIKKLLRYGANKNIANANNETALSIAQKYNFVAGELLLSSGKEGKKYDEYAFIKSITIKMNNGSNVFGKVISQDKNSAQVKTDAGIVKLNKDDILFMRIDE
jgi:ankyrin repeat protein